MRLGQFQGDTNAVNRRREAAEEQLLLGTREDLVQSRLYRPLAGGVAGAIDVGRVLEEGQHAPLAVLSKGMQVEGLAVRGREIDFEVAGVHNHADWSFNSESDAVHQAVGDTNRLDGEDTEVKLLPRRYLDQFGAVEQLVFFQ